MLIYFLNFPALRHQPRESVLTASILERIFFFRWNAADSENIIALQFLHESMVGLFALSLVP